MRPMPTRLSNCQACIGRQDIISTLRTVGTRGFSVKWEITDRLLNWNLYSQ